MENLIEKILKVVLIFCVVIAFCLTMYGAIVLIAMNHIFVAILIFVFVAFVIYWYLEFPGGCIFNHHVEVYSKPTSANIENLPDEYLQAIKKILQRGCYEGLRYEGLGEEIYIAEASIKTALEYYESVRQ